MNRLKITSFSLFLICFMLTNAYCDSEKKEMDIKREKDRTVYTIGDSQCTDKKDRTEEDRKDSWDMLKNMNIRIDKR